MFSDIVVPKGNEQEILAMAKRLGYDGLLMLYPAGKTAGMADSTLDVRTGSLVSASEKADGIFALKSSDRDFGVISGKKPPQFLLGLGESSRHDKLHQRVTGIDQPLLKELKQKKVSVVLAFASLLERKGEDRAQLLGRWMDIVLLCRKEGVRIIIASCADNPYGLRAPLDLESLGVILGMHPSEAKEALSWPFP